MATDRSDEPLAAIDIGTNSIHLVVARPTGNNRFDVIDREKDVVRLGSGSGDMKRLAPDARLVETFGFEVAIGSSGTIVNLMEMSRALNGDGPLRQVSGAVIDATGLAAVVDALASAESIEDRTAIPGLEAKRADIVLGGALVLEQSFDRLGIEEMVVSDFALREGVLLD